MNTKIVEHEGFGNVAQRFNERSWIKQGTWPGSFLWFMAILESFSEEWTGPVLDPRLAIQDYACIGQPHGAYDCLIGANCFDEIRQAMEGAYEKSGPAYFRHYASLCEKKCEEWLQFARSIAEQVGELDFSPNFKLAGFLHQYFAHLRENGAFMDTIIVLADFLGDVVGSSIDALLREHEVDDPRAYGLFLEVHSEPPLPTNVSMAESSIREMARKVRESPGLCELFDGGTPQTIAASLETSQDSMYAALQNHVRRFGWLSTYSFTGQPFTVEQIIELVQERMDALSEAEELSELPTANAAGDELAQRLAQIAVPPQLRELLDVTRVLTYVNAAKDDVHQITWQDIQALMKVIARRLACTVDDLTMFTPQELEDAIREGHLLHGLLRSRAEGWALLKAGDTIYIIQGGQDLEGFRGKIKSILPTDVEILVGRPVFPGKVRGQAKLVLTSNDCDKVQVGDILVATNTSPDFIPAMHRAAAFVTDTGNLICHAVIAAREFRKTCVISTQIATQILVDGEWLEVDGTAGTVTRLGARREV